MAFLAIDFAFAVNYYVNDNSAAGDVYCSVIGNNSNDGLTPATPTATLENLWNTYGPAGSNVITSGDIIYVDAGNYFETDANLNLSVNGISIIGAGYNLTIFDNNQTGSDANRWGTVTGDNITLEGFYITGYNYGVGDAFALQITGVNNLTVNNVMVNENLPGGGSSAIVINGGSSVTFNGGGSSCNPGAASIAGGGVNVEGSGNTVSFNDYIFSNNKKDAQGGSGLYVVGNNTTFVTVTNSKFTNNENYAAEGGGAIYVSGSNLTISGTCFTDNFAYYTFGPNYGGAICVARGATLNISACDFSGNYAQTSGKGGAIGINTSFAGSGSTATVNVTNCSFNGNSSGEAADLYARVGSSNPAIYNVNNCSFSGTGLDIRDDNSAQINIQNSASPGATGAGINFINTVAPTGSPATNCPIQNAPCYSLTLPIELTYLRVECENNSPRLHWNTASEYQNEKFVIQGFDGLKLIGLGEVNGQGTTSLETDYFFDLDLNKTYRYFQLTQIDFDGMYEVYQVAIDQSSCFQEILHAAYMQEEQCINISGSNNSQCALISVSNSMGQLMSTQVINDPIIACRIDASNWAKGVYICTVSSNPKQEVFKFFIR